MINLKSDTNSSLIIHEAHIILGNTLFKPSMSREARDLIIIILNILIKHGRRIGNDVPILHDYVAGYQAVVYEDAVLGFDSKILYNKLKSTLDKAKTKESMLEIAWLVPLFNKDWDILERSEAQFRFSHSVSMTTTYNWLMSKFILADFSKWELPKLAEIIKQFSLDEVQSMCGTLLNTDQHSISYLGKCLENERQSTAAITEKVEILTKESCIEIARIFKAQQMVGRVQPTKTDWLENARINRIMLNNGEE